MKEGVVRGFSICYSAALIMWINSFPMSFSQYMLVIMYDVL